MRNLLKKKEFLILIFLGILTVLPIAYGFFYIDKYGVNIPLTDQWDSLVPWTIDYYEGTFDPTILITKLQGDSRLLFPNIIMVSISIVTRLDIKTIFYAGYFFYICLMMFTAWLLFRELNIQKKYFLLLLLPVFYYAFNPYYLYRFIYNLGCMLSLTVLFALLTIYALDRSKNQDSGKRTCLFFGSSILLAGICSFSGAPGLPIWFAGLLQISLQQTNEKIRKIIVWIIATGVLFFTYFIAMGYRTEGLHGTESYSAFLVTAVTYPFHKFLCFMGVLGAEVIHQTGSATLFGIVLTGIFIVLLYTNRDSLQLDTYSKWYALLGFGTLTGLALALTRSGTVDSGSPPTYLFLPAIRHSLDIFLPLMCIYILALIYTRDSLDEPAVRDKKISPLPGKMSWNLVILGMMLSLMMCGTILHTMPGIKAADDIFNKNVISENYLLNYSSASDTQLKQLHPVPDRIRTLAPKLEKLHLSIFQNRTNTSPPAILPAK